MNRPLTVTDSLQARRAAAVNGRADPMQPQRADDAIDSSAIRWVLAATVGFWIVVFEAGRMFF